MPTVSEIIYPAFSRRGRHLGITLYLVYVRENGKEHGSIKTQLYLLTAVQIRDKIVTAR
jgi:hypothetical protein